jgi:hypothetical protein
MITVGAFIKQLPVRDAQRVWMEVRYRSRMEEPLGLRDAIAIAASTAIEYLPVPTPQLRILDEWLQYVAKQLVDKPVRGPQDVPVCLALIADHRFATVTGVAGWLDLATGKQIQASDYGAHLTGTSYNLQEFVRRVLVEVEKHRGSTAATATQTGVGKS